MREQAGVQGCVFLFMLPEGFPRPPAPTLSQTQDALWAQIHDSIELCRTTGIKDLHLESHKCHLHPAGRPHGPRGPFLSFLRL